MKKDFIAGLIGCIASVLPLAFMYAQNDDLLAYSSKPYHNNTTAPDYGPTSYKDYVGVYVRAKVWRTFLQYFEDAGNVQWHLGNNRYLATFQKEGRLCRALFDVKGHLIYTIKYSTEKALPRDVRRIIRSAYLDYAISAVSEVYTNNKKWWVINLEDKNSLVVVQVADGILEERKHFKTHY